MIVNTGRQRIKNEKRPTRILVAGSMSPEQVSGMAASPVTNLDLRRRARPFGCDRHMGTDKMVWSVTLDGKCCERPQVTPDGKIVVVGGDLQDYWYPRNAIQRGNIPTRIASVQVENMNTPAILSPNTLTNW